MKRVLIISYYFPPDTAIGSLRTKGLVNYFSEYGWDPIVLTKNLPDPEDIICKCIKTPFPEHDSIDHIKKLMNLSSSSDLKSKIGIANDSKKNSIASYLMHMLYDIVSYPDRQKGWYNYGLETGLKYVEKNKIDAIISTSRPITCHRIAHKIKLKYPEIFWVADYRDLWSQDYDTPNNFITNLQKRLELSTISNADCLTTVSEPLKIILSDLHKNKNVYAITNGFDPDLLNDGSELLDEKFTITYTGSLYNGKRDPTRFFKALSELIKEKKIDSNQINVNFYGSYNSWLDVEIANYGLQHIVKQCNERDRESIIKIQRQSQILLLLSMNFPQEEGVYTGKLFEYLAAQRPILSTGFLTNCVIDDLLKETNAGFYGYTVMRIKEIIERYYEEYTAYGKVKYKGDIKKINKYNHIEMTRKFSEILNQLI